MLPEASAEKADILSNKAACFLQVGMPIMDVIYSLDRLDEAFQGSST